MRHLKLGSKRGALLFQLPPGIQVRPIRAQGFSLLLPKSVTVAFEFRDKSWFCDSIYDVFADQQRHLVHRRK